MDQQLRVETRGRVMWLIIDREQRRNAVDRATIEAVRLSSAAIRRGLYTLKQLEALPFEQSMAFAESQIALLALTDDAREGQLAFRDKRRPMWSGR